MEHVKIPTILRSSTSEEYRLKLADILMALPIDQHDFVWAIFELEAIGNVTWLAANMLALEAAVRDSRLGYVVSWDNLIRLSEAVKQFTWLTLAGFDKLCYASLFQEPESFLELSTTRIELFDVGPVWDVWSTSNVIEAILSRFPNSYRVTM